MRYLIRTLFGMGVFAFCWVAPRTYVSPPDGATVRAGG